MKVLFVGPCPPPHGGISVHVWSAHTRMKRAGLQSNVLNIDPRAPASSAYIKISGAADLVRQLFRHTSDDWALSVHTNGHNPKSWFVALVCGIAAQFGPAATLTLHSGGVPAYLNSGSERRKVMGRGERSDEALALGRRAGLADAMLLVGDVDHEQCLALMARSDVFVRPTLMDGDSISVREALALGVPVVASNVGTRPEGTQLFQAGNARELVKQLENAISGNSPSSRARG